MKNHGNAPSQAQYAEFSGIVQSRLWSALKGRISSDELQQFIAGNGPGEVMRRLRRVFTEVAKELPEVHACPFFADEKVPTDEGYPPEYAVKSIAEQLVLFGKYFPNFDPHAMLAYSKKLPECPEGAEGPFVIPNWRKFAGTYSEAMEKMCALLADFLPYGKDFKGTFEFSRLYQSSRTREAEKLIGVGNLHHPGADYIVLWAQFGSLHRGESCRRTRVSYAPNEFGLGAFAVTFMLLTHPERLSSQSVSLDIACPGDECPNIEGELCYVPVVRRSSEIELRSTYHGGSNETHLGSATAFVPA